MTHYHYLITIGRELDETASIYTVGIGNGRQGDRDYLFLLAWAAEHNFFFNIRTLESTEFIMRIRRAYNIPQSSEQVVKARDLVRAIKAAQRLPLNQISLTAAHAQRRALDLNYRIFCAISNRA